jgi:hypothetical protein
MFVEFLFGELRDFRKIGAGDIRFFLKILHTPKDINYWLLGKGA